MELSSKAMSISPSSTLAISARANKMRSEGIDVIGFGAGEPDFDTPLNIKEAAIKAINDGFTKYTPASGALELKEAICRKLKKENRLEYSPKNIVVSNGAKHSLVNIFQAICNPGDEVVIPAPYWVSYPEMVKLADAVPVILNTTEKSGFQFSIEELQSVITDKTKAIVINSPNNPTGMIYSEMLLRAVADLAIKKGIYIVSDEIYEKLIYDDFHHISIASFNERIKDLTIIVNGLSKTYSMTGWRIGYTASNERIAKIMSNVQSHATSNPNSIAQKAAVAALDGPQESINVMVEQFIKRRDYMVERINSIKGLSCLKPNGAFYVMMNISQLIGKKLDGILINGSDDFANILLDKAKVALVPGSGFGADTHVRLSYATSMENIIIGLDRIEKFLNK
ncbi:MAG: pyridoxal phosphate-dependent aminotransferase [Acetivibrionales bacterium]